MKIVKLLLTRQEREDLEYLQTNGSNLQRERSLAVLHCAAGKKLTWIAEALNRRILTIRTWLKSFRENGVAGLARTYSPGRPSFRKTALLPELRSCLSRPPREYGFFEDVWTLGLLKAHFKNKLGSDSSSSTITRLMRDNGYSFKRPKMAVPANAPSKEEKLRRVHEIAREILSMKGDRETITLFLDESHFSTEPYVIRGWHKKGEPFFPEDSAKEGKSFGVWRVQSGGQTFLLEKRGQRQH
jgi:transposase